MLKDPIMEELERLRAEHAAPFNYDVHANGEAIHRRQRENSRTYVTLPPRRIEPKEMPPVAALDTNSPFDTNTTVES